jgi:HSP20 family molecular chaperone IbpA
LYITAKRELAEPLGTVYYRHRPVKIDKRVLLPISFKEEEVKVEGEATYENGIVTLSIPVPKSTNIPKNVIAYLIFHHFSTIVRF